MALLNQGYMTLEELKQSVPSYPSQERMKKGPVAIIECAQEIPCNPCMAACKFGAISIDGDITNLPVLNEEKCTGCGLCIAHCSGLAIFVINKAFGNGRGTVSFPWEYMPLPEKGQKVKAVNRRGEVVCDGEIVDVKNMKIYDRTPVVTVSVPMEYTEEVRGIERKQHEYTPVGGDAVQRFDDDMLVCRCEEVTVSDIRKAIADGARDVTGVKRRTRAGMGLCQGRTCEKMVQAILKAELGQAEENTPENIGRNTPRPPVRPVTFGSLAGGGDDE